MHLKVETCKWIVEMQEPDGKVRLRSKVDAYEEWFDGMTEAIWAGRNHVMGRS